MHLALPRKPLRAVETAWTRCSYRRLVARGQADLVAALRLEQLPVCRFLTNLLALPAARRFARAVQAFDADTLAAGPVCAARRALEHFAPGLVVIDGARVPTSGPLLIVANHPGLTDALALISAIGRDDLLILAARRPILDELPAIRRHLILIDETPLSRLEALRQASRHLRQGGAVLLFPGGAIEPDPARQQGPMALDHWSSSLDLLARDAAGGWTLPTLVADVLGKRALALVRLQRRTSERQWLAALLQAAWPRLQKESVRVAFGQPIAMPGRQGDPKLLRSQVLAQMSDLERAFRIDWTRR